MRLLFKLVCLWLMVLPAVMCETDPLFDLLCADKEQSNAWYKCISCCQGLLPYDTAGGKNPYDEARYALYQSKDLNSITLRRMCDDPVAFAERFKIEAQILKRDLKSCCMSDVGMGAFFANKTDCFFECDENPEDLSQCQLASYWSDHYVNEKPPVIRGYKGTISGQYCETNKDDQGCCMFRPSVNAPLEKVCPSNAPANNVCKSDADTCLDIHPQGYKGYNYHTFCPFGETNPWTSYTRPKPLKQAFDPSSSPFIQDIYSCTWKREEMGSRKQIAAEAAFKDWCTSRNGKPFAVDNPFCECRNFNTDKNGESQLDKFQRECANFKGIWSNDPVSPTPQAKP